MHAARSTRRGGVLDDVAENVNMALPVIRTRINNQRSPLLHQLLGTFLPLSFSVLTSESF